jgi:putative oxidoreductase
VERWLGSYAGWIFGVLRVVTGMMYWMHGTSKVLGFPPGARSGALQDLTSLLGVAGLLEVVLGACIILGLKASYAAFIASGEMAAAYFMTQFPFAVLPIYQPRGILGESAVFNCFFFLYVAAAGPGPYSIDAWLASRRQGRSHVNPGTVS